MKTLIIVTCFVVLATYSYAQRTVLDEYVKLGIENNLSLKQKEVDFEIASKALKEAKGLFFPEVSINARYTVASGGRVIEFPIGDLLNPVYSSLNQLMQLPVDNQFPMLDNEEIPFLRAKEHDTKISFVQPVFSAQLNANHKLKKEQLKISGSQVEQYKNELTFEIKTAYFNYCKTLKVIDLIEQTQQLINENLRVNQKLYENNMITKDVVMRAETEISKIKMQQNEAYKNSRMAQGYFNFLLNQPLNHEIKTDTLVNQYTLPNEKLLQQLAYSKREELKQLVYGTNVYDQMAKLNSAENIPSVFLAADYGFQGEEYSFTIKDDYAMVTLALKWTLFKGTSNKAKKDQSLLQKEQILVKKQEVQKLIELEIQEGVLDVEQKQKNLLVAQEQATNASEIYRMVEKKYRNGTIPQIELFDARNAKTQAEMNAIITQYDLMISKANLEKISGTNL